MHARTWLHAALLAAWVLPASPGYAVGGVGKKGKRDRSSFQLLGKLGDLPKNAGILREMLFPGKKDSESIGIYVHAAYGENGKVHSLQGADVTDGSVRQIFIITRSEVAQRVIRALHQLESPNDDDDAE